ncbi:MAG: proline racemase family protein [Flavobacteriaceae bacterium]
MVELVGGAPADFEAAIETVEMHAGGEPVRIVTAGYPPVSGRTILDKRRYAREHLDRYREMLIYEPRGHYDMYGVIPVEPDIPGADMAVLFLHNEGYSTMCGHATIALGRYAVDHGIVEARAPFTDLALQCPCGLVRVRVAVEETEGGYRSGAVSFESVPSFAFALDCAVDVEGIGEVVVDIGYGGAFYAILDAARIGMDLRTTPLPRLVEAADRITRAVAREIALEHPGDADLAFLYGTILTDGRDAFEAAPTRNLCVFAEREVDRSPTGSGVSARIALQHARGLIGLGERRLFESVAGSRFTGAALRGERAGRFDAVRVEVGGHAYYTGRASFTLERGDEMGGGFLLR